MKGYQYRHQCQSAARLLVLPAFLFLSTLGLRAQKITVLDQTKTPLPYAHIAISDLSNKKSETILTNDNGIALLPARVTEKEQQRSRELYRLQNSH